MSDFEIIELEGVECDGVLYHVIGQLDHEADDFTAEVVERQDDDGVWFEIDVFRMDDERRLALEDQCLELSVRQLARSA